MTDEQKPKIENLELKKETIQDLSEAEGEQVKGGACSLADTEPKVGLREGGVK